MEQRRLRIPSNITEVEDLKEYFKEYSLLVNSWTPKKKMKLPNYLMEQIGLTEDEFDSINAKFSAIKSMNKIMSDVTKEKKVRIPEQGFQTDFNLYDIPDRHEFKSLQYINTVLKENKKRSRLVKYRGQVTCDISDEKGDDNDKLKEYSDYLLTVRVYIPSTHYSFTSERKSSTPMVSQEFLVRGRQLLSHLRDRILCPEDYNSAEGDVSENPFLPTKLTNRNIYTSSMFFINNVFYVDLRYPGNKDYSVIVKEWAQRKNLPYKITERMECVKFESLKFRLGYPYLFMHQGNCEHLIIFTDARLANPSDVLALSAYPIMTTFASLRGRRCVTCIKRISKFIVTGMNTLPRMRSYLCGYCLYQYCYTKDGKKISEFSVFKYLDRVALF